LKAYGTPGKETPHPVYLFAVEGFLHLTNARTKTLTQVIVQAGLLSLFEGPLALAQGKKLVGNFQRQV
jgi:hypothetical protein